MLVGFGEVDFKSLSVVFHFLSVPCEMPGVRVGAACVYQAVSVAPV